MKIILPQNKNARNIEKKYIIHPNIAAVKLGRRSGNCKEVGHSCPITAGKQAGMPVLLCLLTNFKIISHKKAQETQSLILNFPAKHAKSH